MTTNLAAANNRRSFFPSPERQKSKIKMLAKLDPPGASKKWSLPSLCSFWWLLDAFSDLGLRLELCSLPPFSHGFLLFLPLLLLQGLWSPALGSILIYHDLWILTLFITAKNLINLVNVLYALEKEGVFYSPL